MSRAWRIARVALEAWGAAWAVFFVVATVIEHRSKWVVAAERRNEYDRAARSRS